MYMDEAVLRHEGLTQRSPTRPVNATNEKEGISFISTAYTSNVIWSKLLLSNRILKQALIDL